MHYIVVHSFMHSNTTSTLYTVQSCVARKPSQLACIQSVVPGARQAYFYLVRSSMDASYSDGTPQKVLKQKRTSQQLLSTGGACPPNRKGTPAWVRCWGASPPKVCETAVHLPATGRTGAAESDPELRAGPAGPA